MQDSDLSVSYLTGLRGLAALFVYHFHLCYPFVPKTLLPYQDATQSSPLQLPIIRITYAGYQMVALFFVLSGVVLSSRMTHLQATRHWSGLLKYASGSMFRRLFRLYLPLLPCMLVVMILTYFGCFEQRLPMVNRSIAERRPYQQDSIFAQISDMIHFFWWTLLDFLSVMRTEPKSVYGAHLWTISREFRGSMILYLSFIGTAFLNEMSSFWCIACVIIYFYMFKMWDVSLFLVGVMITRYQNHPLFAELSSRLRSVLSTLALLVGLYLTSLPTDYEGRIGFAGNLLSMVSGVALVLQSLMHHKQAQWFLSLGPISLLGEISFSLYIIHEPLLRLVGWRLVETLTTFSGGSLTLGLVLSWVIFTPPLLVLAAIYWRFVDKPSVRFSKWLQRKLMDQDKDDAFSVRGVEFGHV